MSKPTRKQVARWYRKLLDAVTRHDGYQPFGYDVPTMRLVHPGFFPAVERLRALHDAADA